MFLIGSEVSLTILGVVSYHRGGGVMVDAVSDSYDEKTRVKSTTIKLTSLDKPVMIHIEGSMGDVRLSFPLMRRRIPTHRRILRSSR